MRTGRIYACLGLAAALLFGSSPLDVCNGARAAEIDRAASPAAASTSVDDLARQLPAIEPAPVIFETHEAGDDIATVQASEPGNPAATITDTVPAKAIVDRALDPAETIAGDEAASPETTAGIEKPVPATHAAVAHTATSARDEEQPTKPVVAIGPAHTVKASIAPLAAMPAAAVRTPDAGSESTAKASTTPPDVAGSSVASLSSQPPAPASEQPATANPNAAGGALYGPELPDAAIAKAILARLGSAKGAVDLSIAAYYANRANRPLWVAGATLTPSARSAMDPFEKAAEHGLKPDAYRVSVSLDTAEHQADTDLALTRAMVRYARDARGARINPRRISALITAEPTIPDTATIIDTLAKAETAGAALLDFQPHQPGYLALKAKLADLRALTPAVSFGDDRKQAFQEAELVANMERWRWLPRDLGGTYIMVNVPDFKLEVVRDGAVIHQTKVIVGKPQTPTPIFSHAMEYLIVNPYWNIPPSIALKEMLPQLKRDPYALQKKGFEIVRGGHEVDPSSVDWTGSVSNVRIRQPPGERNALGFIKFMFPNDHAVYLHDTPSRGLFASTVRAFSHGCVRVFEPFGLAEILLADQSGITAKQLRAMIGKGERTINLTSRIPVHIAYFTSFVDEAGVLQSRPDIYGHSAKVRVALSAAN